MRREEELGPQEYKLPKERSKARRGGQEYKLPKEGGEARRGGQGSDKRRKSQKKSGGPPIKRRFGTVPLTGQVSNCQKAGVPWKFKRMIRRKKVRRGGQDGLSGAKG